jgi:hypothetical protein
MRGRASFAPRMVVAMKLCRQANSLLRATASVL